LLASIGDTPFRPYVAPGDNRQRFDLTGGEMSNKECRRNHAAASPVRVALQTIRGTQAPVETPAHSDGACGPSHSIEPEDRRASTACGDRPPFPSTITEEIIDEHRQPPSQLNRSQKTSAHRNAATARCDDRGDSRHAFPLRGTARARRRLVIFKARGCPIPSHSRRLAYNYGTSCTARNRTLRLSLTIIE
jgi:hypothetical protein